MVGGGGCGFFGNVEEGFEGFEDACLLAFVSLAPSLLDVVLTVDSYVVYGQKPLPQEQAG